MVRTYGETFIALLVYVDDIVVASSSIEALKVHLDSVFRMKDFGPLTLLGVNMGLIFVNKSMP